MSDQPPDCTLHSGYWVVLCHANLPTTCKNRVNRGGCHRVRPWGWVPATATQGAGRCLLLSLLGSPGKLYCRMTGPAAQMRDTARSSSFSHVRVIPGSGQVALDACRVGGSGSRPAALETAPGSHPVLCVEPNDGAAGGTPTTGLLEGPLSIASPGKNVSAPTVWRARAGAPFGGFILPPEVRAKGALQSCSPDPTQEARLTGAGLGTK